MCITERLMCTVCNREAVLQTDIQSGRRSSTPMGFNNSFKLSSVATTGQCPPLVSLCPLFGQSLSTLLSVSVHSLVCLCPPLGQFLSTPWSVVCLCPPLGLSLSTPWSVSVHPLDSLCPPLGLSLSAFGQPLFIPWSVLVHLFVPLCPLLGQSVSVASPLHR